MKQKLAELALLAVAFLAVSLSANAWDGEALKETLKEAMMESNADYNYHKKKAINEENNRIDGWDERDNQSIMINEQSRSIDKTDYTQPNEMSEVQDQELSSTETP